MLVKWSYMLRACSWGIALMTASASSVLCGAQNSLVLLTEVPEKRKKSFFKNTSCALVSRFTCPESCRSVMQSDYSDHRCKGN